MASSARSSGCPLVADNFEPHIGKRVVFGPMTGAVRYKAKVLAVSLNGWVKFWWPNSGGREGWRNTEGLRIYEAET